MLSAPSRRTVTETSEKPLTLTGPSKHTVPEYVMLGKPTLQTETALVAPSNQAATGQVVAQHS